MNVEEVDMDSDAMAVEEEADLPSQERLLDAEAIERVAETIDRPTARLHLQALAKKLRRESEALKRMEKHANMAEPHSPATTPQVTPMKQPPTARAASPPRPIPSRLATEVAHNKQYISIDRFSFDAGGYNAPFVTLYVPLPGVGTLPKEQVSCQYTKSSFDLVVHDLNNKSYRLFRDHLEKDIDPDKCKLVVKADEVRIKLHKVKQKDYGGYDYWSKLTENPEKKKKMEDPASGIMDLMKQMYDEGDDNMKRMIGETMMKQRNGELNKEMGLDDKFKL